MMSDVVGAVRRVFATWAIPVDIRDGAENPAQELEEAGTDGLPLPRIVFIENGANGNLQDRYDGSGGSIALPGTNTRHLYRGVMTRVQTSEARVWAFDKTRDGDGQSIATPLMHRAAVNRLLHWTDGTGLFPALCAFMGSSDITWAPKRGYFDNDQKDIKFGALYVFEFEVSIPVIASRVVVATPQPAVAIQGS